MPEIHSILIRTEHDIVNARHTGRKIAKELGYSNIAQSRITTAISEVARNIFLYAKEGTITIKTIQQDGLIGIQVTAEDHGPGIKDVRKAMEDGYSTSGGLGAGLPGVKRMMDEFTIYTDVNQGTKITMVKWRN